MNAASGPSSKGENDGPKDNPSLKNNRLVGKRLMCSLTLMVFAMSMVVLPAAAAEPVNGTVDWAGLGDMIAGASGLFPSITTLIMAVIPIMILLIIVGFITGVFDGILGGIKSSMNMFH